MNNLNKFNQAPDIYTVSRLNNEVRFLLEDTFPTIWLEGEISNFAAPGSGHWYFSMKDASAQVRCALFRGNQRQVLFTPKDGMHVLIRARVSLYPNRGEYQLIAEHMEERGEGKLRRAYELLKQKLADAGLFAEEHKKPLPTFPKQIGVITSATGAALRDILTVLKRRHAHVPVIIYPSLVQGEAAALNIVQALQIANQRNECDVLIVARGGGSLEDLWPFNEEIVAQAIFQSSIPIISGVGHEVDFTIADFVADVRAPTPSAAAEIATPDKMELLATLARSQILILRQMQNKLATNKQHVVWTEKHLAQQHPKRRLAEKMQRLDFCELALFQLYQRNANRWQSRLQELQHRLQRQLPTQSIKHLQNRTQHMHQQLNYLIMSQVNKQQLALSNAAATLDALSPLATLKRGYAIATTADQQVLRKADEVKSGDKVQVKLMEGKLDCLVV